MNASPDLRPFHSGRFTRIRPPSVSIPKLLCASCFVFAATTLGADRVAYTLPFSYESRGVGSNPISRELIVQPKMLTVTVSRALLQSLQELQFSVPARNAAAAQPLDPKKEYVTDVVPVTEATIAGHNLKYPNLQLQTDVHYALQYRIQYNIDDDPHRRRVIVDFRPVLYYRGDASNKWRECKREYSGEYLTASLLQLLDDHFGVAKKSP